MQFIILIYVIWRAVLLIAGQIGSIFITPHYDFLGRGFALDSLGQALWPWANYDGEHYLWIAKYGYRPLEYAFFPLYPFLIKAIGFIWGNHLLVGLLISNIFAGLALAYLYKLMRLDLAEQEVKKGIFLFLVFPATFFLGAVYSESLFLFLSIACFYYWRTNRLVLSSIAGLLAGTTRLVGVSLLAMILGSFKKGYRFKQFFWLTGVMGGIGSILLMNYFINKDPLYFVHVQSLFGANRSDTPVILLPQVLIRYTKIFFTTPIVSHQFFIAFQEFFITILGLAGTFFVYKQFKRVDYLVYCLIVLLVPTLTGTLSSMPRYTLAAFPIFFAYATLMKNRIIFSLVCSAMFVVQIIDVLLFLNGYWVS